MDTISTLKRERGGESGTAEIVVDTGDAEPTETDDHPGRHRQPEQPPYDIGAFSGAFENQAQCVEQREIAHDVFETGAAGGHLVGRQVLQINMPSRDTDAKTGCQENEPGIDAAAKFARVMECCHEENDTQQYSCDALKYAQRARVQQQYVLRIQRKTHHAGTGKKPCQVKQSLVWNCHRL